ncbi:MAG: hypothetical protein [Microviridae sp.]|nr:MAG: hypothetical protein [Microviridae sp.]
MTKPKPRAALYNRLMRQLRENDYGCFTDETREEYFKRISIPPLPAPRGKPGLPPSYWTELAGITAPETPEDWAATLPQVEPLPADHPALSPWGHSRKRW